jgi:phosphorylcholine metabolism protein LicD
MAGKKKLEGKNSRRALKLLKNVTATLNRYEIPYLLEGGTLLGIVRENRLLPWDNDMDISLIEDYKDKLLSILPKLFFKGYIVRIKRYKFNVEPFKKGEIRIIKIRNRKLLFIKGDVILDIFIKKKIEDKYYWTVGVKKPVLKSVPKQFYEDLTEFKSNNHSFMVPEDYDGYLTYRYGDWKTTVKEWNFKKDDKAIVSEHKDK